MYNFNYGQAYNRLACQKERGRPGSAMTTTPPGPKLVVSFNSPVLCWPDSCATLEGGGGSEIYD